MGGKRIEGHIGDDAKGREFLLDRPHRLLRDPFGIPGLAGVQRLLLGRSDGEKCDGRDPEPDQRLAFAQQFVHRYPFDARHGSDRLPLFSALDHEHGVNQRVHGELRFAHEPTGELVAPHAPHPNLRK